MPFKPYQNSLNRYRHSITARSVIFEFDLETGSAADIDKTILD